MEGMVSIMQLTSLPVVISAAIFLTWLAKYYLADVQGLNRVPTWIYTCLIAAGLTLIANRVTGTLPGNVGVLLIDAIINAALASGVRSIVQGLFDKLGDSGTAQKKRDDAGTGSVSGRSFSWLLPLLVGALAAGASGCAGTLKPPVITGEDQAQVRVAASKVLGGIEVAGIVVRDSRQLVSDLAGAGIVPIAVRTSVNNAVISANDLVQQIITELAAATRLVTVEDLKRRVVDALQQLAALLEAQADSRVQTAGKFLRSAMAAIEAMGGAR